MKATRRAIERRPMRRMQRIRRAVQDRPTTVGELTDKLVVGSMLGHQRQLAINETLAHIACLRYAGLIERRQAMVGLLMLTQTEQDIGRAGNQNHLFIADAVQRRHIFIL